MDGVLQTFLVVILMEMCVIAKYIESEQLVLSVADSINVEKLEIHLILGQSTCLVGQNILDLSQIVIHAWSLDFGHEVFALAPFVVLQYFSLPEPDNFKCDQQGDGDEVGKTDEPTPPCENRVHEVLLPLVEVSVLVVMGSQNYPVRCGAEYHKNLPQKSNTELENEDVLKVGIQVGLNVAAFRFGVGGVQQDFWLMPVVQTHANHVLVDLQGTPSEHHVVIVQHVLFLSN